MCFLWRSAQVAGLTVKREDMPKTLNPIATMRGGWPKGNPRDACAACYTHTGDLTRVV